MDAASPPSAGLAARLDDLALLGMLVVQAAILTAAMVLQYGYGEVPCPLCLLQRLAMFGIGFGAMTALRHGDRARSIGIGLVSAVVLLVVAGRQTLIDVCPLPGRSYVGSAVLGLHMPVWSVIVALASIAALAAQLALLGDAPAGRPRTGGAVAGLAGLAGLYLIALCAINLVSVLLQCGFGACHTEGYRLLF